MADLAQVLRAFPPTGNGDLIVGAETGDDAAVYRLTDDLALVQTLDFIPPVVDDPFTYGQIAAANALSDVYAMGGKPLTAMNIVGFPMSQLDLPVLGEILRGGASKVAEAGASIVGGHTIDDVELKYGLSVTGTVHPQRAITNANAKPGDLLVLTKPLGIGVLTTAIKRELGDETRFAEAVASMTTLNAAASEAAQAVGVRAGVDVTGFGLLGHLSLILKHSGVGALLKIEQIPIFAQAIELAGDAVFPGGAHANYKHHADRVDYGSEISEPFQLLLNDPQTSGGLLLCVPEPRADELLARLRAANTPAAAIIGRLTEDHPGRARVIA